MAYPHAHLDAVISFVIEEKSPLMINSLMPEKSRFSGSRPRYIGHATTIEKFSKEFAQTPQAQKSTEQENNDTGIRECFFGYLENVRNQVESPDLWSSEEELDAIMDEYITLKMKKGVFPQLYGRQTKAQVPSFRTPILLCSQLRQSFSLQ